MSCLSKPISLANSIVILLVLLLTAGCGDQFAGRETHVPAGVSSVAIPTLVNKTLEPGLEVQFTQAFVRTFVQDQRVNVVERTRADSVLEGTIKSFYIYSVSYDKSGYALEYQTIVTMDIALKKRNGDVLWREKDLLERAWYRTSPSVIASEDNKTLAIQQIAQSLSERILNRFFYNF